MRALSSVSRVLFSVRMMSDGSLLTGNSRLVGHSCLSRRYFDGEAVQWSDVMSVVVQLCRRDAANVTDVSQEMPRSALLTVLIFPFDHSRSLTNSVVELNRPIIIHWWPMTFTSLNINTSYLASRWLVGSDDVIDSSGNWLLGRYADIDPSLNVHQMWFSHCMDN